jgi:hypothetical protein
LLLTKLEKDCNWGLLSIGEPALCWPVDVILPPAAPADAKCELAQDFRIRILQQLIGLRLSAPSFCGSTISTLDDSLAFLPLQAVHSMQVQFSLNMTAIKSLQITSDCTYSVLATAQHRHGR